MAYSKSTASCDGDHAGFGSDDGEIDDGDEIFCRTCHDKLEEENKKLQGEIEELQKKLENAESEADMAKSDRDSLEEKVAELEKQLEEKGGG